MKSILLKVVLAAIVSTVALVPFIATFAYAFTPEVSRVNMDEIIQMEVLEVEIEGGKTELALSPETARGIVDRGYVNILIPAQSCLKTMGYEIFNQTAQAYVVHGVNLSNGDTPTTDCDDYGAEKDQYVITENGELLKPRLESYVLWKGNLFMWSTIFVFSYLVFSLLKIHLFFTSSF